MKGRRLVTPVAAAAAMGLPPSPVALVVVSPRHQTNSHSSMYSVRGRPPSDSPLPPSRNKGRPPPRVCNIGTNLIHMYMSSGRTPHEFKCVSNSIGIGPAFTLYFLSQKNRLPPRPVLLLFRRRTPVALFRRGRPWFSTVINFSTCIIYTNILYIIYTRIYTKYNTRRRLFIVFSTRPSSPVCRNSSDLLLYNNNMS